MLVREESTTNALVKYKERNLNFNGTGNYIKSQNNGFPVALRELEESFLPIVYEDINPAYLVVSRSSSVSTRVRKTDLPLTFDFGENIDPQDLRFANLTPFQHHTKQNKF